MGITCAFKEVDTNKLVALADKALYKAKETKNKVAIECSLYAE